MHLRRTGDAETFLKMSERFLVAHEALLNLPFAVARQCIDDPERHPGPNYFAAIEATDGIQGVALMTPPYRLQAFVKPEAITLLVEDLAAQNWNVPGVSGPEAAARGFAAAWCDQRRVRAECRHRLRAFQLTTVIPAPPVPGRMRPADSADRSLVEEWYRAFDAESDLSIGQRRAVELGGRAVQAGHVFVWDDNGPVAQAAVNGTTAHGMRIGMVYTPPSHRRRGYATALVEALSRQCLAADCAFCFLFTDLANPISNSLYPKIGYRPIADFEDIDFMTTAQTLAPRSGQNGAADPRSSQS
jgi:predicted GNAT family acetyltransferase